LASNAKHKEIELLQLVAQGNERAFGALVDLHWEGVYRHALTYLKSPELAEETTLDVFEKIWHKREQLINVKIFADWLFIVGRNTFISRTRKKIAAIPAPDAWTEDVVVPDKSLELRDLANLLEQGIRQLTPQQQEIFRLSREEGLTHEEIAQRLGLSKHTVKGHLVNALNSLRSFLQERSFIFFIFF
jgi:RNA polymerase sigma-70 factor (ECF subfamily)